MMNRILWDFLPGDPPPAALHDTKGVPAPLARAHTEDYLRRRGIAWRKVAVETHYAFGMPVAIVVVTFPTITKSQWMNLDAFARAHRFLCVRDQTDGILIDDLSRVETRALEDDTPWDEEN
jgi:hypothetical protein